MSTKLDIAYFRAETNCRACYGADSKIQQGYWIDDTVSTATPYDIPKTRTAVVVRSIDLIRRDAARDRALQALEEMAETTIAGETAAGLCLEACRGCTYNKPKIAEAIVEFKKEKE